jgi:hypothetical protein
MLQHLPKPVALNCGIQLKCKLAIKFFPTYSFDSQNLPHISIICREALIRCAIRSQKKLNFLFLFFEMNNKHLV